MNTFVVFYLRHRRHSDECAALLGVALSSLPGTWLRCYEPNDSGERTFPFHRVAKEWALGYHTLGLRICGTFTANAMNVRQFSETLSKEHFYPSGVECALDSYGLRHQCKAGLTSTYMPYHRISTQLESDQSLQYAHCPC